MHWLELSQSVSQAAGRSSRVKLPLPFPPSLIPTLQFSIQFDSILFQTPYIHNQRLVSHQNPSQCWISGLRIPIYTHCHWKPTEQQHSSSKQALWSNALILCLPLRPHRAIPLLRSTLQVKIDLSRRPTLTIVEAAAGPATTTPRPAPPLPPPRRFWLWTESVLQARDSGPKCGNGCL